MSGLTLSIDELRGVKPPQAPAAPALQLLEQKSSIGTALTPVNTGTAVVSLQGTTTPEKLNCRNLVSPAQQIEYLAFARQEWPNIIGSPVVQMEFAKPAVDEINALVMRLLRELGPKANNKEVLRLTRQLDERIRGFSDKHGGAAGVTKSSADYEKLSGAVGEFIQNIRNLFHNFLRDAQGTVPYLEHLDGDIQDRQGEMLEQIQYFVQLVETNEEAISKLTSWVAIMEYVFDVAEEEKAALTAELASLTQQSSEYRKKQLRRVDISRFQVEWDKKISEYKLRLWIAYATTPDIQASRALSSNMYQELGRVRQVTIPVFALAILKLATALDALEQAKVVQSIDNATSSALQMYSTDISPQISAAQSAAQQVSIAAELVMSIAQEIARASQAVSDGYEQAVLARAHNEDTLVKAARIIAKSQDDLIANVGEVTALVAASRATQVPEVPELPSAVVDLAPEVLGSTA